MKQSNRIAQSSVAVMVAGLCVAVLLSSCATTRRTRGAQEQGFLGDYSQLQKGEKDEAYLIYINPAADFSKYNAIIIDSVTIWHKSKAAKVSLEDQQMLTDHLYATLHEELGKDYKIVTRPGPGVLRLRAAITEAKGARVVGNTVTTIVPQLKILSSLTGMATDTQVWVGKAGVEGEIVDSMTDERLMAAVEERAGTKAFRALGGKWKNVRQVFDYWADRLSNKLAELRGA